MSPGFQDPYMDPGALVLRNKLGLTDRAALAQAEEKFARLRSQELAVKGVTGNFDVDHFASVHGFLFQDIYSWAGHCRTVNIFKGGTTFEKASRITAALSGIHQSLAAEGYLQGLGRTEFAQRLAFYYGLWNAVHPFREGNGRTTRVVMGQLAAQAGWILDISRIENGQGQWDQASKLSFNGDLGMVTEVLTHAVRDPRALVFERMSRDKALAIFPDLASAFTAHDACHDVAARGGMKGRALEVFDQSMRRELSRRLDDGIRSFSEQQLIQQFGSTRKINAPKLKR